MGGGLARVRSIKAWMREAGIFEEVACFILLLGFRRQMAAMPVGELLVGMGDPQDGRLLE